MAIKFVYIAGPYRPTVAQKNSSKWGYQERVKANAAYHAIQDNIESALEWGKALCKAGYFPIIPQANTPHYDGIQPDEFFLEGYLELMRNMADYNYIDPPTVKEKRYSIFLCPGWEQSAGAREEARLALELGIPFLVVPGIGGVSEDDARKELGL